MLTWIYSKAGSWRRRLGKVHVRSASLACSPFSLNCGRVGRPLPRGHNVRICGGSEPSNLLSVRTLKLQNIMHCLCGLAAEVVFCLKKCMGLYVCACVHACMHACPYACACVCVCHVYTEAPRGQQGVSNPLELALWGTVSCAEEWNVGHSKCRAISSSLCGEPSVMAASLDCPAHRWARHVCRPASH